jgi:hypothetical protein
MVHIELSTDDAALVRSMLDDKLLDLRKEINRTDSFAFKDISRSRSTRSNSSSSSSKTGRPESRISFPVS